MKKLITLFIFFLLLACSEKQTEPIPPDILSEEKMAEVLVDIHLADASMNAIPHTPGQISSAGQTPLPQIDVFKKNNISKEQYDKSFAFYTQHPEMLSEVYELVLIALSKMQAEGVKKK